MGEVRRYALKKTNVRSRRVVKLDDEYHLINYTYSPAQLEQITGTQKKINEEISKQTVDNV